MLEAMAVYVTEEPSYQRLTQNVILEAYDELTPTSARAALKKAFGVEHGGEVWMLDQSYGYRLYPNSTRKVYEEV